MQFSRRSDIVLLEREQIQRVFQEQALATVNSDFVKIGQTLGADGVLLVSLFKEREPAVLQLRLLAVKPGVALLQREYPWPISDQAVWSEVIVAQFSAVLPKLEVLARDAIPISIMGLHAALKSPQAESLERELTLLLYDRLMKEKDVFVLERRRLELLGQEKQFTTLTNSPFWAGSYLLEGIINKDGFSPNLVTLSTQLRPPGNVQPVTLEVVGPRTNLAQIINTLTSRILSTLQMQSAVINWDTLAEANRYANEAEWMLKWRMFPEAKAASESAWALGLQDSRVAQLRVKSYLEAAALPGVCLVNYDSFRVFFAQSSPPRFGNFGARTPFTFTAHPERFRDIVRACELYVDGHHHFVTHAPVLDTNWVALGTALIDRSSWWLRYFYFNPEQRHEQGDALTEVRHLTLEAVAGLEQHSNHVAVATTNLTWLKGKHGAFWFDTPEQGAGYYQQMVKAGQWPIVRTRFINHFSYEFKLWGSHSLGGTAYEDVDLSRPCLGGWNWENRKRWLVVWHKFIDDLCASSDPLIVLEGRYLRCSWCWSSDDFATQFQQLVDYTLQHTDAIFAAQRDEALLQDLTTLLTRREDELPDALKDRIKQGAWPTLRKQFSDLSAKSAIEAVFEPQRNYFKTQQTFDLFSFSKITRAEFTAAQARELLPLVEAFKTRLDALTNRSYIPAASRNFFINGFATRLTNVISAAATTAALPHKAVPEPVAVSNLSGVASTPRPLPGPGSGTYSYGLGRLTRNSAGVMDQNRTGPESAPSPANFNSLSFSNALPVTRFWKLSSPAFGQNLRPGLDTSRIRQMCFRDGIFWLQAGSRAFGVVSGADFFSVDPDTFKSQHVAFQDDSPSLLVMAALSRTTRLFEVHESALYLGLQDSVRTYGMKSKRWERLDLPDAGASRPVRLKDRLFFTTDSSILEKLADGSFQVLASTRRRPAQNCLDSLDKLEQPILFLAATNNLFACVRGDVYRLAAGSNDWTRVDSLPGSALRTVASFDDGILVRQENELFGLYGQMGKIQLLFRQLDTSRGIQTEIAAPGRRSSPFSPRWPLPGGIHVVQDPACVAGDNLWLLSGLQFQNSPAGIPQISETNGCHALLMHFQGNAPEPKVFPLRLIFDASMMAKESATSRLPTTGARSLLLWTPKGLLITHDLVPGFWFIPQEELSRFQPARQPFGRSRL